MRPTRVPFTYCIDYGATHLTGPEFRDGLAQGPPALMHVGHDLPFRAHLGVNAEWVLCSTAPVSPQDVRAQIEQLRAYVADLRDRGVATVIPYLVNCIIWGDHERRLGFWRFFDRWHDYAEFGLGERPAQDPIDWMQQDPPKPADPQPGRWYTPCPNNDSWTEYLVTAAVWAARCGYDGVFMDVNTCWCFCSACQREFRQYLGARHTGEQLRDRFGIDDLRAAALTEEAPAALKAEIQRFRAHSIARNLERVRRAGAAERPGFIMIPNIGPLAHFEGAHHRCATGKDVEIWAPACDYIMYEEMILPGNLGRGVVVDSILQYKLSRAFGAPAVVLCYVGNDAASADLGAAEAAAFSGGGAFVQSHVGWPEVTNRYNRFLAAHGELYQDAQPCARVGLAFLYHQVHMDDPLHLRGIFRACDALNSQQVLWDFATDLRDPEALARFDALLMVGGQFLGDDEVAALRRYVEAGGVLLAAGEVGTHDPWGRPREPAAMAEVRGGAADERGVRRCPLGQGAMLWAADLSTVLPPRPFALYDLAEDDLFDLKGVYERLRQAPPQPPGVGAALVDSLEAALGKPLRVVRGDAPYLRFEAYVRGDRELLLHAVNYDVSRFAPDEQGAATASPPVELALAAPAGWRFASGMRYEPDAPPRATEFEQDGDVVRFTLEPVTTYAVIALRA